MGMNILEASHITKSKKESKEMVVRYYATEQSIIKYVSSANYNMEYMNCDIIELNKYEFDETEVFIEHMKEAVYSKSTYSMELYIYNNCVSIYIVGESEGKKDRTNIFLYTVNKDTEDILFELKKSKETGVVIDYNGKTLEFPPLAALSIKDKTD